MKIKIERERYSSPEDYKKWFRCITNGMRARGQRTHMIMEGIIEFSNSLTADEIHGTKLKLKLYPCVRNGSTPVIQIGAYAENSEADSVYLASYELSELTHFLLKYIPEESALDEMPKEDFELVTKWIKALHHAAAELDYALEHGTTAKEK